MQRPTRAALVALALVAVASLAPAAALAEDGPGGNRAGAHRPPRPVIRVYDPVAIPPAGLLRGIDVSHWQGVIDWAEVRTTGIGFAYVKATEGTTWVDGYYRFNSLSARAEGIPVGAYHYARPSTNDGDATAEADHFLDVATPQPGDLLPVLDLEEAGGLSPGELTAWTLEFAARVRERLGVSPMIYASPSFWRSSLDDAGVVALWGAPLWIAHWRTRSPLVPADDWQDRGWTMWQWSSRGLVPGIEGEVDLDVFAGRDLGPLRLR